MTQKLGGYSKGQDALNALSRGFVVVVETYVLRQIMLASGGELLSNGKVKDITVKYLGAGVHRLKLEEEK